MEPLFFYLDSDGDVGEFVNSLGDLYHPVLEDLVIIATFGPATLAVPIERGIWAYERAMGGGRRVIMLFDYLPSARAYIVLHAFRAGNEGINRSDLRIARKRRKAFP